MSTIHIKSKFDSEYRRFSIPIRPDLLMSYSQFRGFIETVHSIQNIPFTLCYTSYSGDLLPITNDENFRKALESSHPYLQLLIQRKGESWEEKYGYGTNTADRRRKSLSVLLPTSGSGRSSKRNYNISNPEDFRQVSSIIDVDVVPATHRRVRLCKHGESDRSLGFYIRDGTSLRMTSQGPVKCDGIFISRLLEGGLAESTGLLGVGDEVNEVNGIEVHGKTLDQVADMMVANAKNLVVTIKPANQRNSLQRQAKAKNGAGVAQPTQMGVKYQRNGESSTSSPFITTAGTKPISNGSAFSSWNTAQMLLVFDRFHPLDFWKWMFPHLALITGFISLYQFAMIFAFASSFCVFCFTSYLDIRAYDLGFWENLNQSLGRHWLLAMLFPFASSPLQSDGLSFRTRDREQIGKTTKYF